MATYQHLIDVIFSAKNAGKTQAEIERVFKSMDKGSKEVDTASKKMGNFERAMRRVAIVAPVWMIARGAIMSFLRGFSEGFKYMEDFNAAMLKAQAVTHGVTGSMSEAMADLGSRIRNLAQETGESMTKIANAFYQFGTIGFDYQKAWEGAEAATRFAIATQEDSAKVAKILAMTFKILGDTVDQTIPPQQAMEVQLAKMYKLWQVNAGEAGDLTESLRAFLPTANTMNLTMDETIALLSTLNSAAMLGSRGGTLLRTSFSKLIDNADKLASSLGIYVNPQLDTTFDVMMKVLSATKQLSEAQTFPAAAQEIISTIFGGVRGGEPIKALVALYDQLQENLNISTKGYKDQMGVLDDYRKRQEDVINSVSGQLKVFRELRTQLFEQFITGTLGTKDFAEGLKQLNIVMDELAKRALEAGNNIASFFRLVAHPIIEVKKQISDIDKDINEFWNSIEEGLAGKLSVAKTIELSAGIQMKYPKDTYMLDIADRLIDKAAELAKEGAVQAKIEKTITDWSEKHIEKKKEEIKVHSNLLRQIELQKRDIQEQIAIQKLINEGYSESDILIAEIANEVSKIVDQYNSLDAIQNRIVPQLSKQEMLTNVLSENWEKILQTTNQQPFVQEKLIGLAKQVNQIELRKTQILQKQQQQYTDIYTKYEQADMFERAKLRRMLELRNMNPQELVQSFENSAYDKNLIMEYWNTFTQEGQNAIGKIIQRLYDLPEAQITATLSPLGALGKFAGLTPTMPREEIKPITNVTNIGAQNMQVNVDLSAMPTLEEMAELLAEEVKKGVLNDASFQDAWGRIYNIKREYK
jgi:TP901 family phage tail tape measure protein